MKRITSIILAVMIFAVPTLAVAEHPYIATLRALFAEGKAVSMHGEIEAGGFEKTLSPEATEEEQAVAKAVASLLNAISVDAQMNNDMSNLSFDLKLSGESAFAAKAQLGEEGVAVQSDWLNDKPIYVTWDSLKAESEKASLPFDPSSMLNQQGANIQSLINLLEQTADGTSENALNFLPNTQAFIQAKLDEAFTSPAVEHFSDSDTASIRKDLYLKQADYDGLRDALKKDIQENPTLSAMFSGIQAEEENDQSAAAETQEESNTVIPVSVWYDNDNRIVRIDANFNTETPVVAEEEAPAVSPATGTDLRAPKSTATQTSLGGETARKAEGTDVVIDEGGTLAAEAEAADGHLIYAVLHEGENTLHSFRLNGVPMSLTYGHESKISISIISQTIGQDQHLELMVVERDADNVEHNLAQANMVVTDLSTDSACEIRSDLVIAWYPSISRMVASEDGYQFVTEYAETAESYQVLTRLTGVPGPNAEMKAETEFILPSAGQEPIARVNATVSSAERIENTLDLENAVRPLELDEEGQQAFSQEISVNAQVNMIKLFQLLPEDSLALITQMMQLMMSTQ